MVETVKDRMEDSVGVEREIKENGEGSVDGTEDSVTDEREESVGEVKEVWNSGGSSSLSGSERRKLVENSGRGSNSWSVEAGGEGVEAVSELSGEVVERYKDRCRYRSAASMTSAVGGL